MYFRSKTNCLLVAVLGILSFFSLSMAQSQLSTKETIKGTVVAEDYQIVHACYHVCGLSLIVRLDKTDQYVIVQVEYMDNHKLPRSGLPVELVFQSRRWKFKSTRDESADEQELKEYLPIIRDKDIEINEEFGIPAWELLKGAENEKLPFGKRLPFYRVKAGNFTKLK